jgi:hypothetical protein
MMKFDFMLGTVVELQLYDFSATLTSNFFVDLANFNLAMSRDRSKNKATLPGSNLLLAALERVLLSRDTLC